MKNKRFIPEGYFKREWAKIVEEQKSTGRYWQKNRSFDSDLLLIEKGENLAENLFYNLHLDYDDTGRKRYKIAQKIYVFQVLIANLLVREKPTSISLNRNHWKITRYNKVNYFILDLIKTMIKEELISKKKGYYFGPGNSRLTRIEATGKLLEYFPLLPKYVIKKPHELVILHDKNKNNIDYEDTPETIRVRKILEGVNRVNSKADIRYCSKYEDFELSAILVAIYSEKLTWYGRLHTVGFSHVQGLSEKQRKNITINGIPVIERDYKALHPNLLYASIGIQYNGDPYSVVDERLEMRLFLKQILLRIINAKSKEEVRHSIKKWLKENIKERNILTKLGVKRYKPFIDKFFKVHEKIAHFFCKGKSTGMELMNLDGKIALEVVDHFAKKDIPILSIHDSFIVQEQYDEELIKTMQDVYYNYTGYTIKVE